MDAGGRANAEQPTRRSVVRMSAAAWEAIGDDAKHVEDGRYYVLQQGEEGAVVVEVQFTDRLPRRIGSRTRVASSRRS